MIKDLHIRLFEEKGKFWAEIIAPTNQDNLAEFFPVPPKAGWPCPLPLPPKTEGDPALDDFQAVLLELEQGNAANKLKYIGNYLFHFLFGPKDHENVLYKYWRAALQESQSQPLDGMRTVLHPESDRLLGLPWELINNDIGQFLAFLRNPKPHILVRSRWKPGDFPMPAIGLPGPFEALKILVVICQDPDNNKVIPTEGISLPAESLVNSGSDLIKGSDEALRVDAALFGLQPWKVDLRLMLYPAFKEVREACTQWQPHVFHYIGHGGYNEAGPYLKFFEPGKDEFIPLDGAAMSNFFQKGVPRLVVLNACRSGQVGEHSGDPGNAARATLSLCQVLIETGVPAVIAMQADIEGQAAAQLMSDFYKQLVQNLPIDQSLTIARNNYFTESGLSTRKWDWALPALYLSEGIRPEKVLSLDPKAADVEPTVLQSGPLSSNQLEQSRQENRAELALLVKLQVGRQREQLALERILLSADLEQIAPVTLLYGEPEMGKSLMLAWLSEQCVRQGRQFLYADLGHPDSRQPSPDYWEVLRLIRDGKLDNRSGVVLHNELNPELSFNYFNYKLNTKLMRGYEAKNPNPPDLDKPVTDLTANKKLAVELARLGRVRSKENPIETFNDAFWKGLEQTAEPNGLIIFLDHLDSMSFPGEINLVRDNLINRVLNPEKYLNANARKVRLVLVLRELTPAASRGAGQPWNFLLTSQPKIAVQRLAGFPPGELSWLARLWARRYFLSQPAPEVQGYTLTPDNVDTYVENVLTPLLLKRPQRPGRIVNDLRNPANLEDWLYNIK